MNDEFICGMIRTTPECSSSTDIFFGQDYFDKATETTTYFDERINQISRPTRPHTFATTEFSETISLLNDAFDSIRESSEDENTLIERSNRFDYWHACLVNLAKTSDKISAYHRTVLGALISCVTGKDRCDHDSNAMKILIKSTNCLRQPRLNQNETERIVDEILTIAKNPEYYLAMDMITDDTVKSLEDSIERILNTTKTEI